MEEVNAQAYYNTATFTALKSFIIETQMCIHDTVQNMFLQKDLGGSD